jgi:hypothetical protein
MESPEQTRDSSGDLKGRDFLGVGFLKAFKECVERDQTDFKIGHKPLVG